MLGIIASVTIPGLAGAESVIPELALAHLHPVAVAIFVGALIAAVMSSADSALLAAASIFSINILPLIKRSPDDRTQLLATRIAVPVIGTVAVIVALKVRVVYDLIQDANSVLLAAVIAPFILGIWWKKANRTGALVAMAVGFLTWLGTILFAPNLAGDMLGLITCMVTMVIVTLLTQKSDPPEPLRDSDGEEMEMKDRLGVLPLFRRVD
jgi:Na+/proline symporter